MIASLRGIVQNIEETSIVLDVNGLGYQVFIPVYYKEQIHQGDLIFLHTRMIVREDAITLFGFDTREGRDFFDLLITVNGVGPRSALSILSVLNPDTIRRAVYHDQPEIFVRVPGIGQKTAQKIVFHLKDRMPTIEGFIPISTMSDVDTEVMSALTALGYSVVEAQSALQSVPTGTPNDVETRLRIALQYFSR